MLESTRPAVRPGPALGCATSALLVGYARCSTDQHDLTAQRDGLLALGVEAERIYVDHGLTGTNRERPRLREALAACRAGDTLVVTKLDRLAGPFPTLGRSPTSSPRHLAEPHSRVGAVLARIGRVAGRAGRPGAQVIQRGGEGDRRTRPAPARAPAHRSQPRDRLRRRRQGRPADARPQLGDHDTGHLRAPLRGPTGRGRHRDGRRSRGGSATPRRPTSVAPCCPSVARARSGPK